ncbi:hypothetical protein [Corynebacterium cystitidis]|uniref:hypothetical protein n=1 Tax=Corynebacterium cystitidis TaxID=35757 RepID=UPI0038BBC20C
MTDAAQAKYVAYVNNLPKAGDLGPEGLAFIPATDSPTGVNLLVVGNEVSGTATIFQVDDRVETTPPAGSASGDTISSGGVGAMNPAVTAERLDQLRPFLSQRPL